MDRRPGQGEGRPVAIRCGRGVSAPRLTPEPEPDDRHEAPLFCFLFSLAPRPSSLDTPKASHAEAAEAGRGSREDRPRRHGARGAERGESIPTARPDARDAASPGVGTAIADAPASRTPPRCQPSMANAKARPPENVGMKS